LAYLVQFSRSKFNQGQYFALVSTTPAVNLGALLNPIEALIAGINQLAANPNHSCTVPLGATYYSQGSRLPHNPRSTKTASDPLSTV